MYFLEKLVCISTAQCWRQFLDTDSWNDNTPVALLAGFRGGQTPLKTPLRQNSWPSLGSLSRGDQQERHLFGPFFIFL